MDLSLGSTKLSRMGTEWFAGSSISLSAKAMRDSRSPALTSFMYTSLSSDIRVASTSKGRSWTIDIRTSMTRLFSSQEDAPSPRRIHNAFLPISRMVSIQAEAVGGACSPWIPRGVDGPSTWLHDQIVSPGPDNSAGGLFWVPCR